MQAFPTVWGDIPLLYSRMALLGSPKNLVIIKVGSEQAVGILAKIVLTN